MPALTQIEDVAADGAADGSSGSAIAFRPSRRRITFGTQA